LQANGWTTCPRLRFVVMALEEEEASVPTSVLEVSEARCAVPWSVSIRCECYRVVPGLIARKELGKMERGKVCFVVEENVRGREKQRRGVAHIAEARTRSSRCGLLRLVRSTYVCHLGDSRKFLPAWTPLASQPKGWVISSMKSRCSKTR